MRILVVNPNTTASMTGKIGRAAASAASAGTEIVAVESRRSVRRASRAISTRSSPFPGLIEEMNGRRTIDAYVIACFDDTGLDAARCVTDAPVIGIGEAAFHLASLVAGKFSVVTTLARSVPAIEHNLAKYGLAARCAGVSASDVAVLDLELPGSSARRRISDEIRARHRRGQGGGDRARLRRHGRSGGKPVAASTAFPVLDGVACAVKLAESLFTVGLRTSKIGGYAAPRGKRFSGIYASLSPA